MTPTEAIPGHIIGTVHTTMGVLCDAIFAMTHHIKGHPHIEILQLTEEIAADPDDTLHIIQVTKFCIGFCPVLAEISR